MPQNDFYLRYYVGHKGKFGHEFLEFEFRPDGIDILNNFIRICFFYRIIDLLSFFLFICSFWTGKLRYANNSNYKNDTMIRKEVSN